MSEPTAILAPQFADLGQQKHAAETAMWVFLGSEALFFGAIFLALTVYRLVYFPAFAEGTRHLDFTLGTINTAVLLTSSFTMATAVSRSEQNQPGVRAALFATILLGLAFLAIKGAEYREEWREHLVPVLRFDDHKVSSPQTKLFFVLYFLMTALHALHLLIALALTSWLTGAETLRPRPGSGRVAMVGLYWHFVDLVWVFLYPALYLIGRS
jgi:cytochrome c oxidase subunit 3